MTLMFISQIYEKFMKKLCKVYKFKNFNFFKKTKCLVDIID